MLKGMMKWAVDLDHDAKLLQSLYEDCSTKLTALTYASAIRFATFRALDLTHTCCDPYNAIVYEEVIERDDVDVINEEQNGHLKLHEKIVGEFEQEALKYIEQSTNDRTAFPDFWSTHWEVRMRDVLQELDGNGLTE